MFLKHICKNLNFENELFLVYLLDKQFTFHARKNFQVVPVSTLE